MPTNILKTHEKDLGDGFVVRRGLPNAGQRMIGPFVFWDHMGPVEIEDLKDLVVRVHPHIGLSTLTYLFSGAILHRDSLGNELAIKPGAVNWMTAGKGICHSERSHELGKLEAIQLWIALPKEEEERDPSFDHYPAEGIPEIEVDGLKFRLIAGSYQNEKSPVAVFSPLVYMHASVAEKTTITMPLQTDWEYGVYVTKGKVTIEEQQFGKGQLGCITQEQTTSLSIEADTELLFFGGAKLNQETYLWWNLVASSKEKLHEGAKRWQLDQFPSVPGETERIPYPDDRPLPKI